MKGLCELYKTEQELRESHIFPKFAIKHSKRTGSQYLRKLVEPNKRMQDGIKLNLLSDKAEQEFGKREKWFAEKIFNPYLKSNLTLNYNENLFYFATSFLWRVLILELKTSKNIENKWHYNILIECEKEWREFLTNSTFPRNFNSTHLLFMDRVKEHSTDLKNVDVYFTRTYDATIIDNKEQSFLAMYGKFNRFIFWSVLKPFGGEENLGDLKIDPIGGQFKIPQKMDYYPMTTFFGNRIKGINEHALPNEEQQEKIFNEIMKDPEKFWKSDIGQAMYNDRYNLNK